MGQVVLNQILPSLEVPEGFPGIFLMWVSLPFDVIRVLTIVPGMLNDLFDLIGFFLVFWGDLHGVVNGCIGVCSFQERDMEYWVYPHRLW